MKYLKVLFVILLIGIWSPTAVSAKGSFIGPNGFIIISKINKWQGCLPKSVPHKKHKYTRTFNNFNGNKSFGGKKTYKFKANL